MVLLSFFTESPVLAGICLASCLYLLALVIRKSGKSPFSIRYVRPPPQTLVTDRKERDKVLKQSKLLRFLRL